MPHILRRFHKVIVADTVTVEGIITALATKPGVYTGVIEGICYLLSQIS